jgi:hypothetical protein
MDPTLRPRNAAPPGTPRHPPTPERRDPGTPHHPAVPYLARSLAALYVTWGLAAVFVSFDVPRYLRLIRFMALVALAFGALMLFIDLGLGLPTRWVLTEGPIIMLIGAFFLLLSRKPAPAAGPVPPPVPDEPVGVA